MPEPSPCSFRKTEEQVRRTCLGCGAFLSPQVAAEISLLPHLANSPIFCPTYLIGSPLASLIDAVLFSRLNLCNRTWVRLVPRGRPRASIAEFIHRCMMH